MVDEGHDAAGCTLDELDERILFHLMSDARNNSAPTIARELDVSPGTVRNRISKLEKTGVIEGYHAHVNFERTDGRLTSLFLCNVPFADRTRMAQVAYEIPGVTSIRILMGGRRNFQVLAVGEDTVDLRRIGTTLSKLGVDIHDEMLLEGEARKPYELFDPAAEIENPYGEHMEKRSEEEFVELVVSEHADVAGMTIRAAKASDMIEDEPLIVSIMRGDRLITPHGDTIIEAGDIVRLFSSTPIRCGTIQAFSE